MVVNDSLMMREYLRDIITSYHKFELCGTARDGEDALKKLGQLNPKVILLDLEMPNMDGITFIERLMASSKPLPIIVASGYGADISKNDNNNIVFDCLDRGVVDFISIPTITQNDGNHGADMRERAKHDLIDRIEMAANTNPEALVPLKIRNSHDAVFGNREHHLSSNKKVAVIGASTGGPRVITKIFSQLPSDLAASILVIQHMPPSFTGTFAQHLDKVSRIRIKEACEGDLLEQGSAYVAPGDYHMIVTKSGTIRLDKSAKRQGVRPSVNVSMVSASDCFGPNTLGVLLSGMGQDGAFGMTMIKRKGGRTIAQDSATSVVYGMPKAAKDLGAVDELVPAGRMADAIVRAIEEIEKQHHPKQEELQHHV
jgi:two-component system chemotaxis response regulator CheB